VDDIIGVLSVRKFFRAECKNVEEGLRLAEKPYFVPETTKADVLFEYMQKERNYFAVVVDEYGGTSGVITMHDLLEFLVGDLGDKDEQIVPEIERLGETDWAILGSASLESVAKELDVDLKSDEWDTFGGYIIGLLDTIPDDGTTFELQTDNFIIRVERVEDHRIERTRVTKKAKLDEVSDD
jgi:putative hemolysin